jgi:hypothetical protein
VLRRLDWQIVADIFKGLGALILRSKRSKKNLRKFVSRDMFMNDSITVCVLAEGTHKMLLANTTVAL